MGEVDEAGEKSAPRRWWLALIYWFVGVGYLYVGRPFRYALFVAISFALVTAYYHGLWGLVARPGVLAVATLVGIAVPAFVLIDTIRLAVGQSDYRLRWYNRVIVYLLAFVPLFALNLVDLIPGFGSRVQAIRQFRISSVSMEPTLFKGERVIVDQHAYRAGAPQRGDLIAFMVARGTREATYLKRVIGVPGDRVQMRGGKVWLNGRELATAQRHSIDGGKTYRQTEKLPSGRGYLVLDLKPDSRGDNTAELVVPKGAYFVLGDNRDNSLDSRFGNMFGFVRREAIVGRIAYVLWPRWSHVPDSDVK